MFQRKRILGIVLVVAFTVWLGCFAQADDVSLEDMLNSGELWLRENVDVKTLAALGELDEEQLEKLCGDLQKQLQGEDVIALASLRPITTALLPLLEKHEETQPYAAWLKARLEYLDVAEDFRKSTPPPVVKPNQPRPPVPNPGPKAERQVWQQRVAKRPLPPAAQDFVPRLKPIFAAQRVPAELVWLAEVESSFDPRARSPAGAAGLFQLMPATARQQGLQLSPHDERLNPEKSAQAAANYLKYLHGKFRDWRLALAAYNAGEGRVRELLKKHKASTFDDIAVHLPAETQLYVPKVEATLQRREGVALAKLSSPSPAR